jgi:hypothetical protein
MIGEPQQAPHVIMRSVPGIGDVRIEQRSLAGHPVPWQGPKEKRPHNYFDTLETTITFRQHGEGGPLVKAVIKGANRAQQISLTLDGHEIQFTDQALVLNMGNTFSDFSAMYQLERMLQSVNLLDGEIPRQTQPIHATITPYIQIYITLDLGEAGHMSVTSTDMDRVLAPYLDQIEQLVGPKRLVIPVVEHVKEQDTESGQMHPFHHWYVCVLDLDANKKVRLTILESLDHLKQASLLELQKWFFEKFATNLNTLLVNQGYLPVDVNDLRYAEFKQYGSQGCAVTASINIQRVLRDPDYFERAFEDQILPEGISQGNALSVPGDLISEALRRIELALALYARKRVLGSLLKDQPLAKRLAHAHVVREYQRSDLFFQTRAAAELAPQDKPQLEPQREVQSKTSPTPPGNTSPTPKQS